MGLLVRGIGLLHRLRLTCVFVDWYLFGRTCGCCYVLVGMLRCGIVVNCVLYFAVYFLCGVCLLGFTIVVLTLVCAVAWV